MASDRRSTAAARACVANLAACGRFIASTAAAEVQEARHAGDSRPAALPPMLCSRRRGARCVLPVAARICNPRLTCCESKCSPIRCVLALAQVKGLTPRFSRSRTSRSTAPSSSAAARTAPTAAPSTCRAVPHRDDPFGENGPVAKGEEEDGKKPKKLSKKRLAQQRAVAAAK